MSKPYRDPQIFREKVGGGPDSISRSAELAKREAIAKKIAALGVFTESADIPTTAAHEVSKTTGEALAKIAQRRKLLKTFPPPPAPAASAAPEVKIGSLAISDVYASDSAKEAFTAQMIGKINELIQTNAAQSTVDFVRQATVAKPPAHLKAAYDKYFDATLKYAENADAKVAGLRTQTFPTILHAAQAYAQAFIAYEEIFPRIAKLQIVPQTTLQTFKPITSELEKRVFDADGPKALGYYNIQLLSLAQSTFFESYSAAAKISTSLFKLPQTTEVVNATKNVDKAAAAAVRANDALFTLGLTTDEEAIATAGLVGANEQLNLALEQAMQVVAKYAAAPPPPMQPIPNFPFQYPEPFQTGPNTGDQPYTSAADPKATWSNKAKALAIAAGILAQHFLMRA